MNRTEQQSRPQSEMGEQKKYARPKRIEWIKKTNRKLRAVRAAMLAICGMIAVIGLLLLILPAFKVRKIEVMGNQVTTDEEIIAASGVAIGTEIVGTDWNVAISNVEKQCNVTVKEIRLFPKVVFVVEEKEVYRMQYGEYWISLSEDFQVLDISQNEADFAGLLKVKLPAITSVSKGEYLQTADGKTDLAYVTKMAAFLEDQGIKSRVDLLDASDKFNVICTVDGCYQVVLGKVGELESKMEIANEIISLKNGKDPYAVIDVSDVKRSTYRPIEKSELMVSK